SSSTSSVLLVLLDFESPQLARHLKSCYAPALRGSRCPPLLMQQQHKRGSESCVHWEVSAAATEETAVPPEQGSQEVTTSLQQHFLWIRSYRSALLYMLRQLLEHYHIAFPALAAVQPPCAAATGVAAAQAAAAVTSSRLPLNVLYRAAVCVAITGLQHAAAATALHALACGVAGAASRVWLRGVALALEAEAALVVAAVEPASVWSKAGAAEERRVAAFGLAVRKAFSCWRECLLQLQRHRSIWRMQQPRSCSSLPPLPPLALFIKGRMQLASLLHSFAAFCLGALHDANVYSCQNNASNDEARDAGDAAVSRSADNVVQVASSSAVHGTASAAAAVEDATFAVRCQELEKLRQSARAALQNFQMQLKLMQSCCQTSKRLLLLQCCCCRTVRILASFCLLHLLRRKQLQLQKQQQQQQVPSVSLFMKEESATSRSSNDNALVLQQALIELEEAAAELLQPLRGVFCSGDIRTVDLRGLWLCACAESPAAAKQRLLAARRGVSDSEGAALQTGGAIIEARGGGAAASGLPKDLVQWILRLLQQLICCSWPLPPRVFSAAPHPWIAAQAIVEGDTASRRSGEVLPVVSVYAEMRGALAEVVQSWRWLELTYCFVGGRGEVQDELVAMWLPQSDPGESPAAAGFAGIAFCADVAAPEIRPAVGRNVDGAQPETKGGEPAKVDERHELHRVLVPVLHPFNRSDRLDLRGKGAERGSSSAGPGSQWLTSPVVRHRCCLSAGFSNLRCITVEARPLNSRMMPLGETTRASVAADQPELQALDL
ncbi:uncharacterized protein LOC34620913, partial [Cyclospora cayetanensis]|uniref:Uncharacterized protein LOC34620913 n=1 Tax=Cyclospora cayetanensis TaxID=88456 RepID=A0A6P6S1R3_9EIME